MKASNQNRLSILKFLQKYINNISAFQFIQLLRFSSLFIIGFAFSRIYTTENIGYYETLLFIAGALSFFWLRGVLQSFLSVVKEKKADKNEAYLNTFIILVIFSALSVFVLYLFKQSLANFLNHHQPVPFFKWLILYILFSSPANFIEYIYLGLNQPKKIIQYGIVSQGSQLCCLIIPAVLNYPIEISIIGLIVVNVGRFLRAIHLICTKTYCKFSPEFIQKHLTLSYPLIFSALLSGSSQYIDGIIVNHYFDSTMFAIFRYGARELPLAFILANAFSNAMIPEFSSHTQPEVLSKLKRNTTRLSHFLFPLSILLLLTSNWLFPLIFTASFTLSAKVFNVYLLLVITRLLFPQTILIGLKRNKDFLWISAVEIVINVVFSLLFLQWFGIVGVAYATVVAYFAEKIILIVLVKKWFNIAINQYLSVQLYIFYSTFTIISYVIVDFFLFR